MFFGLGNQPSTSGRTLVEQFRQDEAFTKSLTFAIQTFGNKTLQDVLEKLDTTAALAEMHSNILGSAPKSHGGEGNSQALRDIVKLMKLLEDIVKEAKNDDSAIQGSFDLSRGTGRLTVKVKKNEDQTFKITDQHGRVLNDLPLGEIIGFSNQNHDLSNNVGGDVTQSKPRRTIWQKLGLA